MKIPTTFLIGSVALLVGFLVITQQVPVAPEAPIENPSEYEIVCNGRLWNFSESVLTVGDQEIPVAVARDAHTRQAGLGGCSHIPIGSGMYFVFDSPVQTSFWMKDMQIPIDIVWIADGVVIHITENVQPQIGVTDAELEQYSPGQPVSAVLELAAGEARQRGITVGDSATAR